MSAENKTLRLHFDLPKREEIGDACILVYEEADGFSLVTTSRHGGDTDVFLTKAEFAELHRKLAEIVA